VSERCEGEKGTRSEREVQWKRVGGNENAGRGTMGRISGMKTPRGTMRVRGDREGDTGIEWHQQRRE